MKSHGGFTRSFLPGLLALALGGIASAQPTNPVRPANPAAPRRPGARQNDWPKQIRFGDSTVFLDAPQAESLEGTQLKASGTLRVQRPDEAEPSFGTVWYEAEVAINRDRRTVTLVSVHVPRVQLAGVAPARQQRLATRLSQVVTRLQWRLPLDDVLAGAKLARRRDEAPPKFGTDPPKIIFETEPAVLVLFDGEPRFHAVEGSRLERALNTPFLVLHDLQANTYYLDGGTTWFRASNVTGPWTPSDNLPQEAVQIARRDLKEGGVSDRDVEESKESADKRVPKILVATEPTELIVSDGPPTWRDTVAGELDAMGNSESDVFQTLPDHRLWVVLSGRWYQSEALSGPWTYVEPDQLPRSFRRIPSTSPNADVLAFVPGTGPARDAVRDADAPRTAAIRRSDAKVDVTYDGEPQFESIPGTHVEYALNTPDQVLRIRGRYYACDQGVWFSSGSAAGPWRVADAIPDDEIQTIPPESPVYNTRFATVYDSTPDTVYVAYTPAYLGSYPYYGTVVFGTGWFYRPWWGAFYYPRPWTWGFHARYAPWGGWGFGWGPAWGWFRWGFGFGWGARWCGPGGFFRPAFRNVNITRNVNVNRNVNVTRNLYNAGANKTRTRAAQAAAGRATGAPRTMAKTGGASPRAGKAHPGKGKAGGKTGGKAGGEKKKH